MNEVKVSKREQKEQIKVQEDREIHQDRYKEIPAKVVSPSKNLKERYIFRLLIIL